MIKNLVLYHANCFDGLWAAWAALQGLGEANCIPAAYNTPIPPEAFDCAHHGGNVYIVDFWYPLHELKILQRAIADGGGELQVIDHHKDAMDDLASFSDAIFDTSKSGAVLTWEFFNEDAERPTPPILHYVQDRDLWQHKLPWTRQIHAAMSSKLYGAVPEEITDRCIEEFGYSPYDEALLESMANMGRPKFRERMEKVRSMALTDSLLWANLGDGFVPVVEADKACASDVGHMLCEIHLDRPYAIAFRAEGDGFILELRSLGFLVNKVAKTMGGGGHPESAGCPIPPAGIELWATTDVKYIENCNGKVLPPPHAMLTSQGLQIVPEP